MKKLCILQKWTNCKKRWLRKKKVYSNRLELTHLWWQHCEPVTLDVKFPESDQLTNLFGKGDQIIVSEDKLEKIQIVIYEKMIHGYSGDRTTDHLALGASILPIWPTSRWLLGGHIISRMFPPIDKELWFDLSCNHVTFFWLI